MSGKINIESSEVIDKNRVEICGHLIGGPKKVRRKRAAEGKAMKGGDEI